MIAAELRAQEYEIEQVALRQTALQQLRDSNNAQHYHDLLLETPSAWKYWTEEGFTERTILGFQLGYCAACPLDYPAHRPSATIPIYAQGKLWNIRHRVLGAEHGKYLPERKNLPQMMFNADNLLQAPPDYMMLVEGEKKSMACTQYGWWSVGVMGQDNFNPDWADAFNRFERVYVVLDPDALDNAHEIASLFDGRGYVVSLPDKLDDLLHKGGTDPDQVWNQIEQGERV
jgi:DNA primase